DHPRVASASLCATFLGLYMIDCTFNGFLNVIYLSMAGGIIGLRPVHLGFSPRAEWSRGADGMGRAGRAAVREKSRRQAAFTAAAGGVRLADRLRSLGRTLKTEGRLPEAETTWRQALDLLSGLAAIHPEAPDLQQRWCDCANDLAWLQLNHS